MKEKSKGCLKSKGVDGYFELEIAILLINFNKVKEKLRNIKILLALTILRCILIMLRLIKD